MKMNPWPSRFALAAGLAFLSACGEEPLQFEITLSESVAESPVTGRLFLSFAPEAEPEPRIAAYTSARRRNGQVPFFAVDIDALAPGRSVTVSSEMVGFPYSSLESLPPRAYFVQAVLHVYTKFERSDGHAIWAPMDQWEGQRWGFSPGNLVSPTVEITVPPSANPTGSLQLETALPAIEEPDDTEWVKRVKIESRLLTEFWGQPIHLGATVLLPKGFHEEPEHTYPAVYQMGHFDLNPPFGATPESMLPSPEVPPLGWRPEVEADWLWILGQQKESGFQFFESWTQDDFPRVLAIKLQHPTPFFDDSYGINSANNGPYGDAITTELIPHVEQMFRAIGQPHARVLTGGSTGGWISLAMQIQHPGFFGGAWVLYPDPVDFRRAQLIDIYADENAFLVPGAFMGAPERMFQRTVEGQPLGTIRQMSQLERAQGSRGRSGGQLDAWNAAYGPVGKDGYPMELWDKETGRINPEVAEYWRESGADLTHYLKQNWSRIGPDLVGKLFVINPEKDDFYLDASVYLLEEFLEGTTNPAYAGEFIHGRPQKGHGWQPWTNAELIRLMAAHMK